jgi:hypothetical protein
MRRATTFVHLHKVDIPVKVVNVSIAPTAGTVQRMKDLLTEEIFDGRCAVDTLPSAGDSRTDYRPQENPAKRYITDGGVDAGGILRSLLRTSLSSSFAASLPTEVPSQPP